MWWETIDRLNRSGYFNCRFEWNSEPSKGCGETKDLIGRCFIHIKHRLMLRCLNGKPSRVWKLFAREANQGSVTNSLDTVWNRRFSGAHVSQGYNNALRLLPWSRGVTGAAPFAEWTNTNRNSGRIEFGLCHIILKRKTVTRRVTFAYWQRLA